MEIKKGMLVTRNSYNNDIVFKVLRVKDGICYLKGSEVRLLADAYVEDLNEYVPTDRGEDELTDNDKKLVRNELLNAQKNDFFFLPAKVLHIDGDSDFLERCLKFYKEAGIYAIGKKIKEDKIYEQLRSLLNEYNPDIIVITGHDAFFKKNNDKNDLKNYKNTEFFIRAVKEARKYEKSHEKLVIIAGACQSDYEALIKAGANFASSPKRVNIHALDPAIIATTLATTARDEPIDLIQLLSKTKNGKDGIGGIQSNGLMYIGYPRE